MNELKPCPFCGGEAKLYSVGTGSPHYGHYNQVICQGCLTATGAYWSGEQSAIDAWNTRAAYETEGFFYLPKPKQRLFNYTTGFSFDDASLKATGTVDVYALADAVRKWQEEELNQRIIERICEVFKPERTCKYIGDDISGGCSECRGWLDPACAYCPSCGAKVVE